MKYTERNGLVRTGCFQVLDGLKKVPRWFKNIFLEKVSEPVIAGIQTNYGLKIR